MRTASLLFALLFVATVFASNDYTIIPSSEIIEGSLIHDLRQLGANFALQKSIHQEPPRLPNGYWKIVQTESAQRRVLPSITYYKFTVQVQCLSNPELVRATYEISFASNGDTNVISSIANKIPNTYPKVRLADAANFADIRLVKKGSAMQTLLDKGVEFTVKDAVEKGLIKKSSYTVKRIFWARDLGFTRSPGFTYSVLLTSAEGYSYRVEITSYHNYRPEQKLSPRYKIYKN